MTNVVSAADLLDTVRISIPSKAEYVAVARLAVAAVASRLAFSLEAIEDVKLAMAEACTNGIRQAAETGELAISCEVGRTELRIVVSGPVAEFGAERERVVAPEDSRIEGLGVFLIESIMDETEYTQSSDGGTRLVMTKRLDA